MSIYTEKNESINIKDLQVQILSETKEEFTKLINKLNGQLKTDLVVILDDLTYEMIGASLTTGAIRETHLENIKHYKAALTHIEAYATLNTYTTVITIIEKSLQMIISSAIKAIIWG